MIERHILGDKDTAFFPCGDLLVYFRRISVVLPNNISSHFFYHPTRVLLWLYMSIIKMKQ